MKTQDMQLFAIMKAYDASAVLQAVELYKDDINNEQQTVKDRLKKDGWVPQKQQPENREFYFLYGQYWVQSDEMRQKQIDVAIKKAKATNQSTKNKKYTGQKMDLKYTDLKCPVCNHKMYKQSVCGGCLEGKRGFKIRLLCEENIDHEVLL